MKYSKLILFGLLIITLVVPFASFAHAAKTPNYVGIKAGQTYIWDTEFDAGSLEDYYEDTGETDKITIENDAIDDLEYKEYEEEVTQWKLNIYSVSGELETDRYEAYGVPAAVRDVDTYVEYTYTLKEYDGDAGYWRRIDSNEVAKIWEPNELFWAYFLDVEYGGLISPIKRGDLKIPALVVPNNLDWDQIGRDFYDINDVKYSRLQEVITVEEVEIQYYLGKKEVGIYTEIDLEAYFGPLGQECDSFESISKYNDDGVLYYYEYTYDGDIIAKLELKGMLGYNTFIAENWWWMSIVAAAAVVGVIILICVIIKKTRK